MAAGMHLWQRACIFGSGQANFRVVDMHFLQRTVHFFAVDMHFLQWTCIFCGHSFPASPRWFCDNERPSGGIPQVQMNDHTKKMSDHAKQMSDHVKKASDHAKKTSDHAKVMSNHVKKMSDHATMSDHAKKTSDHAKRTNDHATKMSDHAKKMSDHARKRLTTAKYERPKRNPITVSRKSLILWATMRTFHERPCPFSKRMSFRFQNFTRLAQLRTPKRASKLIRLNPFEISTA